MKKNKTKKIKALVIKNRIAITAKLVSSCMSAPADAHLSPITSRTAVNTIEI